MKKLLNEHFAILLIVAVSFFSLAAALISQYQFGLQPCVLCIYQRWPHGLAAGLAVLYLLFAKRMPHPIMPILVVADLALLHLVGTGIASYHTGVEYHWWAGTSACGVPQIDANDIQAIRNLINSPVVRCDTPAWTLFGFSMAFYNAVLSFGLFIYASVVSIYGLYNLRRIHD